MNVKFLVGFIDGDRSFVDEADVEFMETAKEEIEEIIKEFNAVESFRHGKEAELRKLIKIIDDDESASSESSRRKGD